MSDAPEIVKEENVSAPPKQGKWYFTPPKKLKSNPTKNAFFVNLKDFFGFVPEIVGVFKSPDGQNNAVMLGAFMTAAQVAEAEAKIEAEKATEKLPPTAPESKKENPS